MQKTTDTNELVNDLFEAGAHRGFVRSRRHPSVAPYLHSTRSRKDIINLEKTVEQLATAEEFATTLGRLGKTLLIVGTKAEARTITKNAAEALDMPYATERWIGGILTNLSEIKKRVLRYNTLRQQRDENSLVYKTKKEKLMLEREIAKLARNFHGISEMESLPDALLVIDSGNEHNAVIESHKLGIPVIAISNTDCDIDLVKYPIVANDTLIKSIAMLIDRIKKAYQAGKNG